MKTKFSADDVMVAMPLFQSGRGGSIPTSARQLHIERISRDVFMPLNEAWHSRLPDCAAAFYGHCYGALWENRYWAVAWWSTPVARAFNGRGYLELRRLAICEEAPANTASRMLAVMRRDIEQTMPEVIRLISYQDTAVHAGTIYRAAGWQPAEKRVMSRAGWHTREFRKTVSAAPKVRWELELKPRKKNEPYHA